MKKIALFAAVAFVATATMTSCSKKEKCTCTINGEETVHDLEDLKGDDAKAACAVFDMAAQIQDENGSCEL